MAIVSFGIAFVGSAFGISGFDLKHIEIFIEKSSAFWKKTLGSAP